MEDFQSRLTSVLAAIGQTSIDSLEDFIFLHGAARLVPLSADEPRSLETQQLPPTTPAEEVSEIRKRALIELKDELKRKDKELEYTHRLYEQEREEKLGLRRDLRWFLDSQRQEDRPPSHADPARSALEAKTLAQLQTQLDEANAVIDKFHQQQQKLQAEIERLRPALEQAQQRNGAAAERAVKGLTPPAETLSSAAQPSSATVTRSPATRTGADDATTSAKSKTSSSNAPASTTASPLRSARLQEALYETLHKRYLSNKKRADDITKWAMTKLQTFIADNPTYLAQLPPTPPLPPTSVLPELPPLKVVLGEPSEDAAGRFSVALSELKRWDDDAQAVVGTLLRWKSIIKDTARRVAALKEAKDASKAIVAVKKRRKVKKSPADLNPSASTSSSTKRSSSPLKEGMKAGSPRRSRLVSEALNGPASGLVLRVDGVFGKDASSSAPPASPPKRVLSPSPSAQGPRKIDAPHEETQIPDSPMKSNKRKGDLGLEASASAKSKRARRSSFKTNQSPLRSGVQNSQLESSPQRGSPSLLQRQQDRFLSQKEQSKSPEAASIRAPSIPASSWGPEPDTEPDDFFPPAAQHDTVDEATRSPSARVSSQGTRSQPPTQPAILKPVELSPFVPSVARSQASATRASSRGMIVSHSPLSQNFWKINALPDSDRKASVNDDEDEDEDDEDNVSKRPPSPSPSVAKPRISSSPVDTRLTRTPLIRSPANRPKVTEDERPLMRFDAALGSPPLPQADSRVKKRRQGMNHAPMKDVDGDEERGDETPKREKSRVHKLRERDGEAQSDDGGTAVVRKKAETFARKEGKKKARKSEADADTRGSSLKGKGKAKAALDADLDEEPRVEQDSEELVQSEDDVTGHDFMRKLHAKRAREAEAIAAEKARKTGKASPEIEINPGRNAGKSYHFYEVERNKAAREQMFAHDCEDCAGYYARAHAGLVVPPNHVRSCNHAKTSKGASSNFLAQRQEAMQDLLQKTSRHRKHHRPDPTPPDFWQMGFPSTAQVNDINARAEEIRQERQRYQLAEASKEHGFYRYRDDAPKTRR
ncbi:BZ3500_MvSof-1268-A1-R1_Chr4-2g07180 [Microbotryum saponariae]|uniref:BZ3500_MvSof-1268-A1-R1_Chr4-2g07180 protein n=1 Tax=Microbotryum saponariae TaxID=289078 RepID=A0A2X0KZG7_9BASI|nr:BZ3500_MvSof-1268-A1-R1_Chr4-2g07180 [Microbotryum saponariae]SDA06845.1 BZ3501_MvSof-1269-A2-R1_Chr4-2g06891 [Microbotryum saponariae]